MTARVMEWDGDTTTLEAWIEQWVTGHDCYSIHPHDPQDGRILVLMNGTMGTVVRPGDRVCDTRAVDGYPGISVVNDSHA